MSPYKLTVMIHIYCCPGEFRESGIIESADAFSDTLEDMLLRGIINKSSLVDEVRKHPYSLTEKGEAWLKAILSTPIPKQVWVDSNGKIID
jgi:DNA-binding HxlR family transcriptional regulator